MGNLIDGKVTERSTKRLGFWSRCIDAIAGTGPGATAASLIIGTVIVAPIFIWRWWMVVILAWGFGFVAGWWAARKNWLRDGSVPKL